MELWDLYNEKKEPLGKDHIRGEKIPDGCYHLVVHVWIKNHKGQYLISQRSADRPSFPLMWECTGGSVIKGENSLQGAVRETKEEVGIDLSETEGKLLFTETRKYFNDILDVWFFNYDGDIPLAQATTDEVAQAEWLSPKQIRELYNQKQFVQTLGYFFSRVEGN